MASSQLVMLSESSGSHVSPGARRVQARPVHKYVRQAIAHFYLNFSSSCTSCSGTPSGQWWAGIRVTAEAVRSAPTRRKYGRKR